MQRPCKRLKKWWPKSLSPGCNKEHRRWRFLQLKKYGAERKLFLFLRNIESNLTQGNTLRRDVSPIWVLPNWGARVYHPAHDEIDDIRAACNPGWLDADNHA